MSSVRGEEMGSLQNLAEGEYKLIDAEQFKSEMRASRIERQRVAAQSRCTLQIDSNRLDSIDQAGSVDVSKSIDLPITLGMEREDDFNRRIIEATKNNFVNINRKEIEEVLYSNVYGQSRQRLAQEKAVNEDRKEQNMHEAVSVLMGAQNKGRGILQNKGVGQDEYSRLQAKYRDQTARVIQNYQQLSNERNRHQEVAYFRNKDRKQQQIGYEQLFQNYQSLQQSAMHRHQREYEQQTRLQQIISPRTSQKEGKECQLCKLAKSHMKQHKPTGFSFIPKIPTRNNQRFISKWEPQSHPTAIEPRINRINNSPARSNHHAYLSSEEKKNYSRKASIEPDENFIEEGSLKVEYLRHIQSKSKQIEREIKVLQTPKRQTVNWDSRNQVGETNSSQYSTKTPRRKIFSGLKDIPSQPYIKIMTEQRQQKNKSQTPMSGGYANKNWFSTNSKQRRTSKQKHNSKNKIFGDRKSNGHFNVSKQKTVTRQLNFNSIREALVNTRIQNYRAREEEKLAEKSQSPQRQRSFIPGLRLMQMSGEVRRWYESNRRQIIFQAEKICSYYLINRYMTEGEVSSRLYQLVVSMVEPKRWLLLMVDEVYARLKDRYLPPS